jgi:hypothetical protein
VEASAKSARKATLEAVGVQDRVAALEAVEVLDHIATDKAMQDFFAQQKTKAAIDAMNSATGGKYDKEAAQATEHMRGTRESRDKGVSCKELDAFFFDCSSISNRKH